MSVSVILSSDDQDTSSGDEDAFEESVSDLEDVSNLISSEDIGNMAKIELNGMCTFDAHGESMKTHQAWKRWLRSFELFSLGKGVTDVDQKRALLLHCAGQDVQDIFFTLPEGDGGNAYEKTTAALEKHFKSKINVPYERYAFRSMKQEENETVEQFVTKLRQQSVLCEFDKPDEQIRDQVIEKCRSHKLRQRLLEKGHKLTLDQLRMMASTLEQAETQAKKMESHQGTLNRVSLSSHGAAKQGHAKRTHEHKPKTDMKCYRCDREGHLSRDPQCPAKTKRCNECGKVGHFAKCCKSKLPGSSQKRSSSYSQRNNGPRKGNVCAVEPEQNNYAFNVSQRSRSEKFRLQVDKQDVDFIVDSGATVNIIDRKLWEQLKQNHITCKSEKT
ncbi:uncharacterized protein LOC132557761 [Ylistrum balloti]|uniref:uncharacterized protein LOC132557761 n=1 Tax=Ylistrum balloti TaxID=509963 RepID=UPI002905B9DE|nr:uncharacterized protein LOC132557761 [Ylistrum balloti]